MKLSVSFCLLLLLVPLSAPRAGDGLLVLTEEWAPYNYIQDGEVTGFSTEIVRAMMAEMGQAHRIRVYPGARMTQVLDRESNVIAFSYFRTPAREDRYHWIGPLLQEAVYIYQRKGDEVTYASLADAMKAETIVVSPKGSILRKLEALGFKNLRPIAKNGDQLRHVLGGRAELLGNFTPIGLSHYLKQIGESPGDLVPTGVRIMDFTLNIAGSRDLPEALVARWRSALDAVRRSGAYDEVYQRYLN